MEWDIISRATTVIKSSKTWPSAAIHHNLSTICLGGLELTVDVINKQLLAQRKFNLALDGWTSINKIARTSVIAYYINQDQALHEVQVAFANVNRQFVACFEN